MWLCGWVREGGEATVTLIEFGRWGFGLQFFFFFGGGRHFCGLTFRLEWNKKISWRDTQCPGMESGIKMPRPRNLSGAVPASGPGTVCSSPPPFPLDTLTPEEVSVNSHKQIHTMWNEVLSRYYGKEMVWLQTLICITHFFTFL